jgi:hypothetical protein
MAEYDYKTQLADFELDKKQRMQLLDEVTNNGTFFGILVGLLLDLFWCSCSSNDSQLMCNSFDGFNNIPNGIQKLIYTYTSVNASQAKQSYGLILTGCWDRIVGLPVKWLFRKLGLNSVFTFKPLGQFRAKIDLENDYTLDVPLYTTPHNRENVYYPGNYCGCGRSYCGYNYAEEVIDTRQAIRKARKDFHIDVCYREPTDKQKWYCLVLIEHSEEFQKIYTQKKGKRVNPIKFTGNTTLEGMDETGHSKYKLNHAHIVGSAQPNINFIREVFQFR